MTVFNLLAAGFIMKAVAFVFILSAVVLVLIVLIQKGRGGGLSGALGGGAAGGILGTKTGDFLTWFTIILAGLFLILAVVMAKFYKPTISEFGQDQPQQTAAPAQQAQPVPLEQQAADANILDQ